MCSLSSTTTSSKYQRTSREDYVDANAKATRNSTLDGSPSDALDNLRFAYADDQLTPTDEPEQRLIGYGAESAIPSPRLPTPDIRLSEQKRIR